MKRITQVVNCKPTTAIIAGRQYDFRSKFESRWALYLQFLKEHFQIEKWEYEPKTFYFDRTLYKNRPFEYTPDFRITQNDGTVIYQELKGFLTTKDNSKYLRFSKHYPSIVLEIVMQQNPKKGKGFENYAKLKNKGGIVSRIIAADEIFRQVKGVLRF
jgi:hypothetical protein